MIMNKTVTETSPKDILKQLAIDFISSGGEAKFHHWETVTFGGRVSVYGDVKTGRSDDYYISTSAELPKKCKFHNEITVFARVRYDKDWKGRKGKRLLDKLNKILNGLDE